MVRKHGNIWAHKLVHSLVTIYSKWTDTTNMLADCGIFLWQRIFYIILGYMQHLFCNVHLGPSQICTLWSPQLSLNCQTQVYDTTRAIAGLSFYWNSDQWQGLFKEAWDRSLLLFTYSLLATSHDTLISTFIVRPMTHRSTLALNWSI